MPPDRPIRASTLHDARLWVAVLGLAIASGLAAAGWFVAEGLYALRASARIVAVKGLAEREVGADVGVWPIVFTVSANELGRLQADIDSTFGEIREFLARHGLPAGETYRSVPRITDLHAQSYGQPRPPERRYLAEATLTLRTTAVEAMKKAMENSGELVGRGVVVVRSYEAQAQFLFTGLDRIKPAMIAEATRDARRAAEQFAQDSGSTVGPIRSARQGYFSVSDLDPFTPERKVVRVVTGVEYSLVD
jgi:hypothetical protein